MRISSIIWCLKNIDTLIKISENQYSYSRSYTYAELIDGLDRQGIEIGRLFIMFKNVSLLYNRDCKINKILK
jgi:hypothetical protein